MRYDRGTWRRGPRSRADYAGRGEYGEGYEGPYPRHGWREGFLGGDLRSRGSWTAGPADELEWGDDQIGGRGYGGTNYDIEHGYARGGPGFRFRPPRGAPARERPTELSSPATRGGYAWGEAESAADEYGPARYGYGPYYDRLRRRRRSDDDVRLEVEETLFYDTWVDADAISVTVADAVVTLRGILPSYDELRYAVDDAWDVDGVRGVHSDLQVNEDAGTDRGTATGRYDVGAPHMHGHPDAGESGVRTSTGRSRSTSSGSSTSTGTGEQGDGGRSATAHGATSAPPTGKGMAAGGARGPGGARDGRAGSRRGRAPGTQGGAETRSRRGRMSASGSASGTAEGGTAQAERAAGAGDGGTDLGRS